MESPMNETVYGNSSIEENHAMCEKVQSLASNIYQELERLIERYDEAAVKELMPLVVSVLESLDSAVMDNQEQEVEVELLREDNEQLVTQYEREKQLRKSAEQRLLEIEYSTDDDHRNLVSKVESMESIVRMLELKAKNSSDHASRLEEREVEMKKEYNTLHQRYTVLFKTHMEYMERTKVYGTEKSDSSGNKARVLNFSHIESDVHVMGSAQEMGKSATSPLDLPSPFSPNQSSDSNASLKSELQEAASPRLRGVQCTTEKGQITDRIAQSDRSTGTRDGWVDDLDANLNDALVSTPDLDEVEELDGFSFNLQKQSAKTECRRPNTLYQELSFQDNDVLGEVDEGADISVNDNYYGMGREVENLISENNELLATKNALNVVKDDLIAKVDELTSEQEILREELKQYGSVKEHLKGRMSELEEELKKTKEALEKAKSGKSEEEEDLPMAQRKRFTRVEMARVLMERNQYKERLMELQEAVRWTEMIRASRSDSSLDTKRNKSSIWKFFSNLFNANEKPLRKPMPFVNVHYSAPTNNASPALETMRRKRLGDRHRGIDVMDNELVSEKFQQQRARERREQYKQVRAHVRKEDGRMQAYGWSLPTKPSSQAKSTTPSKSSVPVPVPVFCRPLLEKETGMKVWCAAGVDLSGGREDREASKVSVVGSSQFYVRSAEVGEELEKLESEITTDEKVRSGRNVTSLVWLCSSTYSTSKVTVIDANDPAEILDSFSACSSHLLCIASVPGVMSSDLPTDEKLLESGTKKLGLKSLDDVGKIGSLFYIQESADTGTSDATHEQTEGPSSENGTQDSNISTENREVGVEVIEDKCSPKEDVSEKEKMPTRLPTMWLGSQAGKIYVHSSVAQWWQCIDSIRLKDSVLSIIHLHGRVFAALADGSVVVFHRKPEGDWDLHNFHLLDLGRTAHSVRCMTVVDDHVWCGYRNCIHVVNSETLSIAETFDAHPRKESQVRQMAWAGVGVWVTIRLDSTLRLYHATTRQHLQDVDIEPYVSKMLGTGKLGFSFVRITALLISCKRLWMGTGNGVIISVPLSENKKQQSSSSEMPGRTPGTVVRLMEQDGNEFVPYCSMAQAQLSFHGHRDAVKFFVAVPGNASITTLSSEASDKTLQSEIKQAKFKESIDSKPESMLVLSGGEGYIDFRIGDDEDEEVHAPLPADGDKRRPLVTTKNDRSHLIVWQMALNG